MTNAELSRRLRELLTMSMFVNSSNLFEALNQQRAEAAEAIEVIETERDAGIEYIANMRSAIDSLTARAEKAEAALREAAVALKESKGAMVVMAGLTGCRSDDEYVWSVQAKVDAALSAIGEA